MAGRGKIPTFNASLSAVTAALLPRTMSFKDHFSGHARDYARFRPSYPNALIDWLAENATVEALAWDAGCGSGQLSVLLARRFQRVIATDASAEQLARATRHRRVEYRNSRAEESGIAAESVDLAVAAQAVHWFDLPAYYREVRRTGRPDSMVALVGYGEIAVGGSVDEVISRFYNGVLAPYWPPERRLVEEGYRSLPFPFEEVETPSLEMEAEWGVDELLGYIGTWSAVAALVKSAGPNALRSFGDALAESWGAGPAVRRVRWPLSLRAGRL
jgi:SAM-dependent methyltransferase